MGLFAAIEFPTLAALAALVLTIALLLWRSQRYWARQEKGSSPIVRVARPQPHEPGDRVGAPDAVLRWEVQMHETARELSGQLDSKMRSLAHLIREADRAAARLESALESAQPAPDSPLASTAATNQASPMRNKPDPVASRPSNQAEALKFAGAGGHCPDRHGVGQPDTEEQSHGERRYEEIYMLADYGFSAQEIARRVGSPVGEVELILGLRAKR